MHKLRLLDFLDRDEDSLSGEERASLPTLPEVMYTQPNPDGSAKACRNCVMYATQRGQCYLHDPGLSIRPNAICSYHVYCPTPMRIFTSVIPMRPLQPDESRLRDTEGGAACEGCCYYAGGDEKGECMAAVGEWGEPAKVEAKGLCSRWECEEEEEFDFEIEE